MDFLNDIAAKTGKLTDMAKLSAEIATLEKEMNQHLILLGKEFYVANKDSSDHASIKRLKDLRYAIKEKRQLVDNLKGTQKCKSCQATVNRQASFCPSCGNAMPKDSSPHDDIFEGNDV